MRRRRTLKREKENMFIKNVRKRIICPPVLILEMKADF